MTGSTSHIDLKTGRPVEVEGARYENGPVRITPYELGAHSWHAMSYNPNSGLVYIPTMHLSEVYSDEGIDLESWQSVPFEGGMGVNIRVERKQPERYPASLIAWDPINQKEAWSVQQDEIWNAGTLTTAGNLVFQGRADGVFLAYDAETGEMVWQFDTGLGISAPPITYKIGGIQYLSLLVGWGGGLTGYLGRELGWAYRAHTRRLITFSLEGEIEMPKLPPPFFPEPTDAPDFNVDATKAEAGKNKYERCVYCHGIGAIAGGMAPDLRASPFPLEKSLFESVVRNGSKVGIGMPGFPEITDEELSSLMHYIRQMAKQALIDSEQGNP